LKQIYRLIIKEYRLFWSDRVAVSLTFIVPLVLIMVFGAIFGGMNGGAEGIRLVFVNESSSPVSKNIESALDTMKAVRLIKTYKDEAGKEMKFDSVSAKEFVRKGNASAALILPADMYADTSIGVKAKLFYDPKNDIETQMLQGIIQRTIFQQMPDIFAEAMQRQAVRRLGLDSGMQFNRSISSLLNRYFKTDTVQALNHPAGSQASSTSDSGSAQRKNFFENIVHLDKQQLVGQDVVNPWATRAIGGWAMMFLLFMLSGSAGSLFDEKKAGIMLRLLASPISRTQILWSKYLYNMSLGIIQLVFLFIVAGVLFNIDVLSHAFNLMVIIVAAATACTAFGMVLAAFCRTAQQVNGWGTLLILTMSAVGGAWFPTSFMPGYILAFSKLTIVYWAMDGFMQVLWRGSGILSILPNVGILLGIAAIINIVSVFQFKKGHIF